MVRSFVEQEVEPQALVFNREERFNEALFRRCGELGLLGLTADEKHGGSALDAAAVAIVHEELSASDPAFALSYLAHSLLFVNNLNFNGSEAQKARYLPDACAGRSLNGMGMSEAKSGTDVLAMASRAVRNASTSTWTLSGSKMWITKYVPGARLCIMRQLYCTSGFFLSRKRSGARSDTQLGDAFLIYARTGGGEGASGRYSLFLVDRGMPGFSLGHRIKVRFVLHDSS
jgi:isovaleryl-CoA dehydrogenase